MSEKKVRCAPSPTTSNTAVDDGARYDGDRCVLPEVAFPGGHQDMKCLAVEMLNVAKIQEWGYPVVQLIECLPQQMVVGEIDLPFGGEHAHVGETIELDLERVGPHPSPPADRHQPQAVRQCGIKWHQFRPLELLSNDPCDSVVDGSLGAKGFRALQRLPRTEAQPRCIGALLLHIRSKDCEPEIIAAEVSHGIAPSPSRPRSEGCRGSRLVQHAPAVRQRAVAVDGLAGRPVSAGHPDGAPIERAEDGRGAAPRVDRSGGVHCALAHGALRDVRYFEH